jgi:PKD repeat protein
VEERNTNMELDELFRSKLENAEVAPGAGVRADLMKKAGRMEFVRFNPSRFNIYYLGGIVAAAITAAIIIGTGIAGRSNRETKPLLPETEVVAASGSVTAPTINTNVKAEKKSQDAVNSGIIRKSKVPAVTEQIPGVSSENSVGTNKPDNVITIRPDMPEKSGKIMGKITGDNNSGYQLQKKTLASFNISMASGCLPLKVKFTNTSVAWDSCRWIFGDGGYSGETDPAWLFDVAGEYKVTLRVFGPGGSESSYSSVINVYPRPKARFEIEPQAPIIPDDQIRFVNYSLDAVRYRWEFGDGMVSEALEPEHKYNRYGSYNVRLIAWSEHGCTDSVLLTNAFAGSGCYINFPNAFIPNADGPSGGNYSTKSDESAQIFHPVTSGVSDYQLRIFSKIGIFIFESNDINTGWDGYHKGQLCEPGVYIWKVRGTYKNGEPFVKMGDLTLLKK